MRKIRLGTQLNISFILVLCVPMIIATVFSIVFFSQKIQEEAINQISSEMNIARIIYRNALNNLKETAVGYSNKNIINFLIGFDFGGKISRDWAESARTEAIDMITIVDTEFNVLVRSHAPDLINMPTEKKDFIQAALGGEAVNGTEILSRDDLERTGLSLETEAADATPVFMAMTAAVPVYDRQREKVVAALIMRRILNRNHAALFRSFRENLTTAVAIFEHTNLIAKLDDNDAFDLMPPEEPFLKGILEKVEPVHLADFSTDGRLSKFMPITNFAGKPVGVLMVQTGVDNFLATRFTAITTLLAILITGVLLAFIVKTFITRRIVHPVQRLKEGAARIGSGDYEHRLAVTSGDEIGELTEAFNRMAGDLREYDRQLRDYNQQLEERVKERTAELQLANEQLIQANTVMEETLERLNPGVSRLIKGNQQQLGLVRATELVADVCNYTKLNMILGENMMGEFMKRFFREGHKLLAQYRGMFDKTVGDQIVAIFGTPKDYQSASPAHPFDAIACGLKLLEAAEELNGRLQESIQDNYTAISDRYYSLSRQDREGVKIDALKFQCRIGINTSNPVSDREIDRMRMVMMGAETCIDYTAQGGSIIYAFRLESTGTPGEIHIGENSKVAVDHVYRLEEMPAITLKGLGTQPRYRVEGMASLFENIYPRTRFYQEYRGRIPLTLKAMMKHTLVGKLRIQEIRKIKEFVEVDIPYLEHIAGIYHQIFARALFAFAVGESVDIHEDRLDGMIVASAWRNAMSLRDKALPEMEINDLESQCPTGVDLAIATEILSDLGGEKPRTPEGQIITLCDRYDHMVFDRSLLKERAPEIISTKEFVSLIKIGDHFDPRLVNALGHLMIVEEAETAVEEMADAYDEIAPVMMSDVESLADALERKLTPEQRRMLLERLGSLEEAEGVSKEA